MNTIRTRVNTKQGYDMMKRARLTVLLLVAMVSVSRAQNHFDPVEPTGIWSIIILDDAVWDGVTLAEGDEIAVFDGNLCVGAVAVGANQSWPVNISAVAEDTGHDLPGYVYNNPISYRMWNSADNLECPPIVTYSAGNGNFGYDPYTRVTQLLVSTAGIEFDLQLPSDASVEEQAEVMLTWDETALTETVTSLSYDVYLETSAFDIADLENGLLTPRWTDLSNDVTSVSFDGTDDTDYWWTVVAEDNFGILSYASEIRSFEISIPEPPGAFSLLAPMAPATVSDSDTLLSWQAATDPDPGDAVSYWVWWATDEAFTLNLDSTEVTGATTCTIEDLLNDETYYWKVRAQDSNSEGTWSTETWSFHVHVPTPPNGFDLLTPVDGATIEDDTVPVSWEPTTDTDTEDAVSYVVQWGTDATFTDYYSATTTTASFEITDLADELDELSDDITVYWRVKAIDSNNLETWSTAGETGWSFTIYIPEAPNAFSLLTPAHQSIIAANEVTLSWEVATDPDPDDEVSYQLYWATDAGFSDATQVNVEGVSYTLSELSDDQTYFWKVLATDNNTEGTWSTETWSFSIDIPEAPNTFAMLSPTDGTVIENDTVTVSWEAATDPDPNETILYVVQWSTNSAFTEYYSGSTSETSFEITDLADPLDELPDDQTIYWRVKAVDSDDLETWATPGSGGWSFSIALPEAPAAFSLLTPADEIILGTDNITLTWEVSIDADPGDVVTYRLYYATDEEFTDVSINETATPSYTLLDLADDQTYYWKILAQDTNSDGTWSTETWSFSIDIPEPPNAFAMLTPTNGAVVGNDTVTVTWQTATDPDPGETISYEVHWGTDDTFTEYYSTSTTATSYAITDLADPLDELPDDQTIYWRVKAVDSDDLETWATPGDGGWSFSIFISEPPSAFNLLSPADGSIHEICDVTLTWEAAIDPDPDTEVSYQLQWATDAEFTDGVINDVENTTFTLTDLTDDTEFWWRVHAVDDNSDGTWSTQTWSFSVSVPEPPAAFALLSPADGAVIEDDTVTVIWQSTTDPDPGDEVSYEVQWGLDNQFLDPFSAVTADTFFAITDLEGLDELPDDSTIYWRVKAIGSDDEFTFSLPDLMGWSFSIHIPDAPLPFNLLAPDSGLVMDTLAWLFEWEATSDIDPGDTVNYWLEISLDEAFTDTLVEYYDSGDAIHHTVPDLADDTEYWWRVRAQDSNTSGTYSTQTWTFATAMPELPVSFELLSPNDGDTLIVDEAEVLPVAWTQSWDPDPGEDVTYSATFTVTFLDESDTTVTVADLTDTSYVLNLREIIGIVGWQEYWDVSWYVQAIAGGDTVTSDNQLGFVVYDNSVNDLFGGPLPTEFSIKAIYPNPFNPTTTIVVGLPHAAPVRIAVYNMLGREVALLADTYCEAGFQRVVFNANNLASGLYFVRVVSPGNLNELRKVLLVK